MRQPLAISTGYTISSNTAMHVAEFGIETRVPPSLSMDVITRQIGDLAD